MSTELMLPTVPLLFGAFVEFSRIISEGCQYPKPCYDLSDTDKT